MLLLTVVFSVGSVIWNGFPKKVKRLSFTLHPYSILLWVLSVCLQSCTRNQIENASGVRFGNPGRLVWASHIKTRRPSGRGGRLAPAWCHSQKHLRSCSPPRAGIWKSGPRPSVPPLITPRAAPLLNIPVSLIQLSELKETHLQKY